MKASITLLIVFCLMVIVWISDKLTGRTYTFDFTSNDEDDLEDEL